LDEDEEDGDDEDKEEEDQEELDEEDDDEGDEDDDEGPPGMKRQKTVQYHCREAGEQFVD
jgi:hypothetical protein